MFAFIDYGINSVLYQRGIYPPETFTRKQQYGLTLLVSTDDKLKMYLSNVLKQLKGESYDLFILALRYVTAPIYAYFLLQVNTTQRIPS